MGEMHFIIFHIGPVQDFIAAARRSRDLWFGSWLLSELSKAAALEIVRQNGNDVKCLVFPAPADLSELESNEFDVANKVVAVVSQVPAELGEAVRKAVLKRLLEVCGGAYDKKKIKGEFDRIVAKRQVEDLLEFFWASCSVNGDYEQARAHAEALLAARKVTRNFAPVTWGGPVPKCSLDGCRESVILEHICGQMTEAQRRKNYGIRPGERLCGVGLLKRHGRRGQDDRFLSTSHVAALPLLGRLTEQHRSAVDEYISNLKKLGISSDALDSVPRPYPVFGRHDGHLLFEERLSEYFEAKDESERAKQALRNFLKKALGGERPSPYYALLLADGDRMGKVINEQENAEQHRKLSRCLSDFTREVGRIVSSHEGSLVYSGGDDVLAFVPLHTVLDCARDLAEKFCRQLVDFKVLEDGKPTSPTLSVGIVIAHHLEPLSDVLELARAAEKVAKSVPGKNALAVTLSKRSGVERTVQGRWEELDQRLGWFIKLHRIEAISGGVAYELRNLALVLETSEQEVSAVLQQIMGVEAKRILRRKEVQRGSRSIGEAELKRLYKLIDKKGLSVKQLADELIIAREFAAVLDLAGIPLPTAPVGEEKSV